MSQIINGLYRVIRNENNPARYAEVETKNGTSPVLNLTVVPFRTREGDDVGTEWISVAIWGNAAGWYQNIPHNTLVYLSGRKDIRNWTSKDEEKSGSSPEVTIRMGDDFVPFVGTWRDDAQSSTREEAEFKVEKKSIVEKTQAKAQDDIPF